MRKRPSTLEWRFFDEQPVSNQAWKSILPADGEVGATGQRWRGTLLRLAAFAIALLWLQPWSSVNQSNPRGRVTVSAARLSTTAKTSGETVLMSYVVNGPVGKLFVEAQQQTPTKPNWQPLRASLYHYFWLQQQQRSIWDDASEQTIPWRYLEALPLSVLYPDDMKYRSYDEPQLAQDRINLIAPGTVAEYIITTYGQERLAALLAGFSRYDTWTELSPAIFGIPAGELEAGWHAYLAQHEASHLLDEAAQQTSTKPLWRPVLQGFQHYFGLRQQNSNVWRYIANFPEPWQLIADLSLQTALQDNVDIGEEAHPAQDSLRFIVTATLAEYVVSTYGQQRLPALLTGFSRYDSWEELSPAVFGIPASQLEAGWHAYLLQHIMP